MRCRSCGPQLSSGWYEDTKKRWGSLPADVADLTDRTPELWAQIEPLFETVEEIYFAGGEPLIMEEHYRILNRLIEMGRTDVKLRYNTNMSRLRYKSLDIVDAWQHFSTVEVGASLDSWGARAEYVRKGTVWPDIEANMLRIRREAPHVQMYVTATVGVFTAPTLEQYHAYMVEQGMIKPREFWINPIQQPNYLSVQNLPREIKQRLHTEWEQWKTREPQLATTITALQQYMGTNEPQHWDLFLKETGVWDRIRGENWVDIFPELVIK
jgi:sulfatase maturation enzyme AslB (radical SAM superfamily)